MANEQIKAYLLSTQRSIETEKNRLVQQAKEKATREQVVPHNQEVDGLRDKALNELTAKYNENIKALQDAYSLDRQNIINKAEANKADFAKSALETATSLVVLECDQTIAKLQKLIEEVKE